MHITVDTRTGYGKPILVKTPTRQEAIAKRNLQMWSTSLAYYNNIPILNLSVLDNILDKSRSMAKEDKIGEQLTERSKNRTVVSGFCIKEDQPKWGFVRLADRIFNLFLSETNTSGIERWKVIKRFSPSVSAAAEWKYDQCAADTKAHSTKFTTNRHCENFPRSSFPAQR